jgi:short-subunit dehydrogenase
MDTRMMTGLLARRSLRRRVVVLTGATAGIGRATALRLAGRGATVVAVARDPMAVKNLAASVDGVVPHPADISSDTDRAELVSRTLTEHGRIDALVSNVGIGWSGLVEEMTLDQVRTLVETNLVASMDLARLVVPHMLTRRDGDILFTVSGASWFAVPPLTVYSATKYGLEGFAEGLRREVLARGVRVHTVHPGLVSTEFAARSAGHRPGDLAGPPAQRGPGIAPERVAAAIERALTRPGTPHMVAVPRVLGLTRVVKLPPLQQAADVLVALNAGRLARLGRTVARQAAGRAAR